MLMNLTDVFTSEGKERKEVFAYESDTAFHMGAEYKILEKSPVDVTFTNIENGKVMMQGSMQLMLEIPCDRCLATVKEPLSIEFQRELLSPEVAGQEDMEEQDFMSGYELDTEAFVNAEILVNMPVKVLCKPDCKGICKVCGHNLNEGDCGCDTFVPDPRMAAIKDIFNANKEV